MNKLLPLAAVLLLLLILSLHFSTAHAQGTAFTYQGRLNVGTNAATGLFDLRFGLWDSESGGFLQGNLLTNNAAAVTNGLFTVTLDFGSQFPGAPRWLEIGVRSNGVGVFTSLASRQPLSPAPYAIFAESANASNLVGTLQAAQLPAAVVTNGATGLNLAGTFAGNGAAVTNVPLGSINSGIAIQGGLGFVLASSPTVGLGPQSVTAADVNSDGWMDLISANAADGTLTILTNNGSGGFMLASSPHIGGIPNSVMAMDMNGDGKVDLISANTFGTAITILTNNGSGGFVSMAPLFVGVPYSVVAADVNGDGRQDLVSAADNKILVITNNGSGGFLLAATLTVSSPPAYSAIAADVNGDGRMDVISANAGGNTLTIFTNNGTGGFVPASSPPVGLDPVTVATADVNGDGRLDLISANKNESTLTVLTNNGSGGFGLSSSPVVGIGPQSVVPLDVNGDGKVDLISANEYDNSLTVLTNDGSGRFVLAASAVVGSGSYSVAVADVNGDGRMDLISANRDTNTLSVMLNTDFNFAGNFSGSFSGSINASSVNSGTLNDGRLSANVALLDASALSFKCSTFAAGVNAQAPNAGTFVWNSFGSANAATVANTFSVFGTHGLDVEYFGLTPGGAGTRYVYLGDLFGGDTIHVWNGAHLTDGGVWANASDKNRKTDFSTVDPKQVLNKLITLPVSEWRYTNELAGIKHLGPTAQDFQAVFGLGTDDKSIGTVDESGVALAAIQGLDQKLNEKETEVQSLKRQNDSLEKRISELETTVKSFHHTNN